MFEYMSDREVISEARTLAGNLEGTYTSDVLIHLADRLVEICQAEGLGTVETDKMLRRVNDHRGNWRAVLQEIEAGEFA